MSMSDEESGLWPTFSHQNKCSHHLLEIQGHHALGITVGCCKCNETFDLSMEIVEEQFFHFVHHSTAGPSKDIQLLIHQEVIKP